METQKIPIQEKRLIQVYHLFHTLGTDDCYGGGNGGGAVSNLFRTISYANLGVKC